MAITSDNGNDFVCDPNVNYTPIVKYLNVNAVDGERAAGERT